MRSKRYPAGSSRWQEEAALTKATSLGGETIALASNPRNTPLKAAKAEATQKVVVERVAAKVAKVAKDQRVRGAAAKGRGVAEEAQQASVPPRWSRLLNFEVKR